MSGDCMKTVRKTQNLHLVTLYDINDEAHVSILAAISLTQEASNVAVTALREQFAAPRNLLIPFIGVDRCSANVSIGRKFISPHHLIDQFFIEFGAKNVRVSFDTINFTIEDTMASANIVFANEAHKLERFVRLYDTLKSIYKYEKKGLR